MDDAAAGSSVTNGEVTVANPQARGTEAGGEAAARPAASGGAASAVASAVKPNTKMTKRRRSSLENAKATEDGRRAQDRNTAGSDSAKYLAAVTRRFSDLESRAAAFAVYSQQTTMVITVGDKQVRAACFTKQDEAMEYTHVVDVVNQVCEKIAACGGAHEEEMENYAAVANDTAERRRDETARLDYRRARRSFNQDNRANTF